MGSKLVIVEWCVCNFEANYDLENNKVLKVRTEKSVKKWKQLCNWNGQLCVSQSALGSSSVNWAGNCVSPGCLKAAHWSAVLWTEQWTVYCVAAPKKLTGRKFCEPEHRTVNHVAALEQRTGQQFSEPEHRTVYHVCLRAAYWLAVLWTDQETVYHIAAPKQCTG